MGKIAFVFSGQGDQFPGMGKDLYEKYPAARKIYDLCDGIRPGTSAQCFDGTEEELKETGNTQPCLFATELAAACVLMEIGSTPDMTAGFSLGEVAAELMQAEARKFDTSMAAVLRLAPEKVEEVCGKYSDIYPVNYSCPGQITVSGLSSQMADFFADVKTAGGRAIPLKVKGAFHSPFMNEAAKVFAGELANVKMGRQSIPLYSNKTAEPYEENAVSLLSSQICSPVQWEKTIRNMIADGADTFIEIGPGRTLTNMIRKISTEVRALTCFEYLEEAEGC